MDREFSIGISQQIILNGERSESCPVLLGVPQGSVLGSLLFLCYINDLPEQVKSSIKLYADDALVYRRIHSKTDQENLQEDLSEMITTLGWPTLEQRRKIFRTIMLYKIINNLVEVPTDGILFPSEL